MGGNPFGKEDMYLFMESHKNMVELHTLVLTQLQQIIKHNDDMVKQTDNILTTMDRLVEKIGDYVDKLTDVQLAISNNQTENTKAHEAIKTNLYGGWVGMGSIILLLILTYIL